MLACKSASFGCSWKNVVVDLFEPQHVSDKPCDKNGGVRKDGTFEVCSTHKGHFASLSRNCIRQEACG